MMLKMFMPSMPKMPEAEKKEETAESREEAKEQERLKAAEAKRIEKERTEKYNKLKGEAKEERAKIREKYKLAESPEPSDAEEEDSEDEDDGFGPAKKVDEDPVARKKQIFMYVSYQYCRGKSFSRASDVRSFGCSNKKFGQGEVLVNGWCLQWKLFYKTSYFLSYFVGCELLNKFLLSEAKSKANFAHFINNSHVSTSN